MKILKAITPLHILILIIIIAPFFSPSVELDIQHPQSVHNISVAQAGNIWQEWCEYHWQDGSTSQRYLYTVDASTLAPNETINQKALQECR